MSALYVVIQKLLHKYSECQSDMCFQAGPPDAFQHTGKLKYMI